MEGRACRDVLREVTSCLLDLHLLFRQEPGQGDNVGVDGLLDTIAPVRAYLVRHVDCRLFLRLQAIEFWEAGEKHFQASY